MNVTNSHWLDTAERVPVFGGAVMPTRRCVVIHFTSGATAKSSIDFWNSKEARGASAHVIIDRDGTVYQCRPFNLTCGHAGVSRWQDPKTGHKYGNANAYSIGIELANAGDDAKLAHKYTKLPLFKARHRNGGPEAWWEAYPRDQLSACFQVVESLVDRYNLDDITGHDCIAPERKNDPGPAFPMQALREHCGFVGLPKVHNPS